MCLRPVLGLCGDMFRIPIPLALGPLRHYNEVVGRNSQISDSDRQTERPALVTFCNFVDLHLESDRVSDYGRINLSEHPFAFDGKHMGHRVMVQ